MAEPTETQVVSAPQSTAVIATVAGNGRAEYAGDGHAAVKAGLHQPNTVARDSQGNLYIADTENHRVRKVDAETRTITTVAGNGEQAFYGDDGPAADAALNRPRGVTVDSEGNFYIADTENHRVRRVDAETRTITTVAGSGSAGFGGDGGAAVRAHLYTPFDVVLGPHGSLYIADTDNGRVRSVDAQSQTITTVAGNGDHGFSSDGVPATTAALNRPRGVAVDSRGSLYIADTANSRVRKVDGTTRTITTVAGDGSDGFSGDGGPAVYAALNRPRGVAVDSQGNVYIADTDNERVRKIDSVSRSITTVAGNGSTGFGGDGGLAVNAVLNEPRSIAVDPGGDLYISDTGNNRVRKVSEVPVTAPFSVSPGGTATLERGTGKFGWPGVYVKALGSGGVAPQTVRVTLPAGKGLQFHGSGNLIVYGEDRDGRFGQLASYGGTLSVDKQTFTTDGPVDLHLGTNGKTNSLLIGVVAPADAVLGETKLTFTVGDRPPTSAPVNVTVGFSVSPGGTTTLERGKSAWPGVYAKALGDGGVAPQTVRVTLPPGKGLQFHGSGNLIVYGEDRDGHFGQLASYGGTLSADKQTFTTHGPVDLHLWKAQASNSLLIGLVAPADAVPGETKPTFTVGGQPPTSAPVNVT